MRVIQQHLRGRANCCERDRGLTNRPQFEKILAVSDGPSWRREGLLQAAVATGLELVIPTQPGWTDAEIDEFRGVNFSSKDTTIGPGQTRCWLGHLNVIEYMLVNAFTTVLILEDDVDWDLSIREQISTVAPLIQKVSDDQSPWSIFGGSWDLLWLGHCGDNIPISGVQSFYDKTLPISPLYRENDGRYTRFEQRKRMVYRSRTPVCTYAYALTRHAASIIYSLASHGSSKIITLELRQWCSHGILRCITVNPELFHHHKKAGEVQSQIAFQEGWDDLAKPVEVDYTANIRYSARCNAGSTSSRPVTCQNEFGLD